MLTNKRTNSVFAHPVLSLLSRVVCFACVLDSSLRFGFVVHAVV